MIRPKTGYPHAPERPDMYGPRGTEFYFREGELMTSPRASWSENVQRWQARQARGFDRGELSLPEARS